MLQQTFIINKDSGMKKKDIVVQVAHAECFYMAGIFDIHIEDSIFGDVESDRRSMELRFKEWVTGGVMKKIVLKSKKFDIHNMYEELNLKNIWSKMIFDMGFTHVPKNTLTCLVVEPLPEKQCNELFGHLKSL